MGLWSRGKGKIVIGAETKHRSKKPALFTPVTETVFAAVLQNCQLFPVNILNHNLYYGFSAIYNFLNTAFLLFIEIKTQQIPFILMIKVQIFK